MKEIERLREANEHMHHVIGRLSTASKHRKTAIDRSGLDPVVHGLYRDARAVGDGLVRLLALYEWLDSTEKEES